MGEKIFCCHGGLSPDLQSMEQIRQIMRPTDVQAQGLLCDRLWSDPNKDVLGWKFDNAGAMMIVDETLMCSFQILKPAEKKKPNATRPVTPPRGPKGSWLWGGFLFSGPFHPDNTIIKPTAAPAPLPQRSRRGGRWGPSCSDSAAGPRGPPTSLSRGEFLQPSPNPWV
ncbi:hypothetical protein P7K49_030640 [Saguinus oedipus]|uniref:protein-serine/threonine phosphatase n=1 Tax=Saguinus oedipus TaxID=9490 RepID=A0ABQ9U3G8_SAGOE|nr:hypothetical protein P7K49_030640 [Saguinus oedipus]